MIIVHESSLSAINWPLKILRGATSQGYKDSKVPKNFTLPTTKQSPDKASSLFD